jgi:hypothetical protein
MKRLLMSATAAALLAGVPAGEAAAQEMRTERGPSRFDLGVYAGGAYTSSWFESRSITLNGTPTPDENDDGEGYRIGLAPMFGANATFWATPVFGFRAHYGYMPSNLPEPSDGGDAFGSNDDYVLNNHFYDLSLIFRLPNLPLFSAVSSNLYGWAGGGGLTSNVAGSAGPNGEGCEPRLLAAGACLSYEEDFATVGQGVVGIGGDILGGTRILGLGAFAELAAHIYDSPVHVGDGFLGPITAPTGTTVRVADDRYAVTTRLVLGLKAAFGSFAPAMAPLPPPPPPPPVAPEAPSMQPIQVCVLEGQQLRNVDAMFNPSTGDTMVMQAGQEQPFGQAFPATQGYAAGQTFFINNEPVMFGGHRFVKFGPPRVIGVQELARVGEIMGVQAFAEAGAAAPYEVIYLPVRTGCEFQPYQAEQQIRVRG